MNQVIIYAFKDSNTDLLFNDLSEEYNKDVEIRFALYLNKYDNYNNNDEPEIEDNDGGEEIDE